MNGDEWFWVRILGIFVLLAFAAFLFCPKYRPDAVLLGFFTLGIGLIGVSLFKPDSLKFEGWELTKKVEKIEKELRPFAIVDISFQKDRPSKGLLYQTFKSGEFTWFGHQGGGENENYKFRLNKKAKYLEVRCDRGNVAINKTHQTLEGLEYTFSFINIGADDARCIIEAFLE